jgi:hypothetical protein
MMAILRSFIKGPRCRREKEFSNLHRIATPRVKELERDNAVEPETVLLRRNIVAEGFEAMTFDGNRRPGNFAVNG